MSTMDDILSTVGCSVSWRDIMINLGDTLSVMGDIMSTMRGYCEYRGGRYLEYRGGIS